MAQYKFEGDFQSLNERQLEFVNEVVEKQGLKAKRVIFNTVGQAGDNFIGNVKRITIDGESESMKMIVKIATSDEMARFAINHEITFRNEHIMYTEVLPKLVELQKAAGVPEKDQLRYAECYGSLNEVPNEVIILEDLNESHFSMLDKFKSLSNECVRNVLKGLATYHSLSFVLKKQEPEKYEDIKNKLTDGWSVVFSNPMMDIRWTLLESETIAFLDDKHKHLVENKLINMLKGRAQFLQSEDESYSVIQQGDAWTNNIMFKLEDDSIQSIMIDYQFSTNGNPTLDLLYIIFNCTDHETRSKYYHSWIDHYYLELDKSLSNFGLKASLVYPRNQLDIDMKKYARYMFHHCILFAHLLMRDPSEAADILESFKTVHLDDLEILKSENLQSATIGRIKNKIDEVIASYEEFGLF
uniref:CHK kinase-like domain-containing protein n=1 Tax=Heliothis virescens TaxID=7102 RepID=A0A2A4JX92_HELVI